MNTINTVDSHKFSLNGIEYLKNYISVVRGNRLEVFNCYERADILIELTHYSQFTVNGVTYASAAAVQAALLDVLYARIMGSGDIVFNQDNIDLVKRFTYHPDYTTADILDKINTLPSYTVTETQSIWFKGVEPVISGGSDVYTGSKVLYKMMRKGKAAYGIGGIQLTGNDIELVLPAAVDLGDIETDPDTDIIDYGTITGQTISDWLNLQNPPVEIQAQDAGYTLFKGTVDGVAQSIYGWVLPVPMV